MKQSFFHLGTAWENFRHFASEKNLWKEKRLACEKAYATGAFTSSQEEDPTKLPPWQEALFKDMEDVKKRVSLAADSSESLLSKLDKRAENQDRLSAYMDKNKNEIAAAVYKWGDHSIDKAREILEDIIAGKPPEQIRMKIEEVVTPKESPDELSRKVELLKTEKPEQSGPKKKRWWDKILEQVAELMKYPLYRRVATFLKRPSVEKLGLSVDKIFQNLSDPSECLSQLREIGSARHSLVVEREEDVEDRRGALDDLLAIFNHAKFYLSTSEIPEFYEMYSRVMAAFTIVDEEYDRNKKGEEVTKEQEQENALSESQDIREFLKNERGMDPTMKGDSGLLARLEKRGSRKPELPGINAYKTLSDGLKGGNWLDELMPEEDGLRYNCTLVILEEIAILENDIAYNRAGHRDLRSFIKGIVESFKQKGSVRSGKDRSTSVHVRSSMAEMWQKKFDELEKDIESRKTMPTPEESNEILFYYAHLHNNDPKFDADGSLKKKLIAWHRGSESTAEELKEEEEKARKELEELSLSDFSLEAEILKDADLDTLLAALTELLEEQQLGEWHKLRSHLSDKKAKKRAEYGRGVSTLFKTSEEEYLTGRRSIIERLKAEGKDVDRIVLDEVPEIASLNEANKEKEAVLNVLDQARVNGCVVGILNVIEATVKVRAAELQEQFLLGEKDWGDLPLHKLSRISGINIALYNLKRCELDKSNVSLASVKANVGQVGFLGDSVENFDKHEADANRFVQQNAADAAAILKDTEMPERFKKMAKPIVDGDAVISNGRGIDGLKNTRVAKAVDSSISRMDEISGKLSKVSGEVQDASERLQKVRERIEAIAPTYFGRSDVVGDKMKELIEREYRSVGTRIRIASYGGKNAKDSVAEAVESIERLESFVEGLESVKIKREEDAEKFKAYVRSELPNEKEYIWGVYNRSENEIVLNAAAFKEYGESDELTLLHERKHARNHFFTKFICPLFMVQMYDEMEQRVPGLEERCLMYDSKEGLTEDQWKHEVMDEFTTRMGVYSDEKNKIDKLSKIPGLRISEKEIALFNQFSEPVKGLDFRMKGDFVAGRKIIKQSGDEDTGGDEAADAGVGTGGATAPEDADGGAAVATAEPPTTVRDGYVEGSTTARKISDIDANLIKIKKFIEVYPKFNAAGNAAYIAQLEEDYDQAKADYARDPHAESNENITARISHVDNELGRIAGDIARFDAEQRDLRDEPEDQNFFLSVWRSTEFMSVHSFVAIYKAIVEDIKRQHERREQGRIGRIGKGLTEWITKIPVLKDLPYINTLSAEFQRRDKQNENDEVENYKKALVEVDSYELQDMLHHPSNRDHMKAILHLLSERGRIDWSDTKFWDALSKFSRYTIPVKECERNENLREDWLRKVVSDIWTDKELYRTWKTQNDSNIKSEKEKFTPEADRLSNVNALHDELEKQLRIFVEVKRRRDKGESVAIPDDVQPHLYEKILEYSITNGKMSMEQKMYYLVQGTAYGLISLDRLRTLAGEEGGLLQIFPFIDYFYTKNNTRPEIEALAARLRETEDISDSNYFKPGMKTTLWLELEVARESKVQERLRKGVDKKAGDMDHDDMHFFIPRLDYQTVKAMAAPRGGGVQKMSTDGWRNGYIGYNGFFKSLGMLSQLENEGEENAKFTSEDAYQAMRAVAGFIQMDGILTVRSNYGDTEGRRPAIPFPEMKNTFAVYNDGEHTVYQDRAKVNDFVRAVLESYLDDSDIEERFTDKNTFINLVLYNTEEHGTPASDEQEKIHYATQRIQTYLEHAVTRKGTATLKRLLMEHMPEFHAPSSSSKMQSYNYDNAKAIWKDFSEKEHKFRNN